SDDKIAWYENHGNESFTPHTITIDALDARSVYAVDVDDDGDMDVLSASGDDDKIAWYENDGNENFTPHTITTGADFAFSVYAVDVDGDGDMDVLSASILDDKIAWYENDGNENFTPHTITTNADGARSVYAIDVDGDGDMDVLSASQWDDKITWFENDGNESFTPHTITTGADGAWSVYAMDVDGDGDMDVLSASAIDNKIAWYENDGNENFTPHTITTSADGANSVYAVDVDGDGDMDVLSASVGDYYYNIDSEITWYENDGNESFTPHIITTNALGANSVYAVDVDNDGDMDVLSASAIDDKIAWYENLSPVGVESISNEIPIEFNLSQNYPNPFNPSTTIRFSIPEVSFVTIKVFNTLGEEITTLINENIIVGNFEVEFYVTALPSGIYFYRLQAGSFVETKKMVFMK
ncbi:MAG: T9SS type A sorting domain-containing protein, partial [Bacteroidetes bacterium]|nr:T9SS type A sorting domain-containing protein [Bacteroidota bacterium]